MAHPVLLLVERPPKRVVVSTLPEHQARVPRSDADVAADVDALIAQAPAWVVIGENGPAVTAGLEDAIRRLGAAGIRTKLVTDGRGIDADAIGRLAAYGLGALIALLHAGDDAVHDAIVGEPGAAARLRALLAVAVPGVRRHVRAVLTPVGLPTLPALVEACAGWHAPLELHGALPLTADVDAALSAAWTAAAAHEVELVPLELGRAPKVGPAPARDPLDVDLNLVRLVEAGAPWSAPRAGTKVGPNAAAAIEALGGLDRLGATLGAHGATPVDLPRCLGGVGRVAGAKVYGCDDCPAACGGLPSPWDPALLRVPPAWEGVRGKKVAILHPWMTDKVLTLSTLPGLARSLKDQGADVRWISAWEELETGVIPTTRDAAWRARSDAAKAVTLSLDLADRDLVIAPTWPSAAAAFPLLGPKARLVVADWHLLDGFDRFKPIVAAHGGWPENVVVHACFRAFSVLFRRQGIPPRQVRWRAYPFDTAAFRPGPPPVSATWAFAGGNQRRDWTTLLAAGARLGAARPVRLLTRDVPEGTTSGPITAEGSIPLAEFYAALASARYVVVPVVPHPDQGAGITLAAMAHAAGRPVIATAAPGLAEQVIDGTDGLLVPAGDPAALAAAMTRLDQDDALCASLGKGALAAARRLSTDTWAEELRYGGVSPI